MRLRPAPPQVHASGLHASFARLREHMQVDAKRAAKLDQRAGMLTQGYQRRAAELGEHLTQLHREGQEAAAELLAFQVLFKQARMGRGMGAAGAEWLRSGEEGRGRARRLSEHPLLTRRRSRARPPCASRTCRPRSGRTRTGSGRSSGDTLFLR